MSKSNIHKIEVTASWCQPFRANKMSGKYTCDAINLTEEDQKFFRSVGINANYDQKNDPQSPDFKGFFVKFKSDTPVRTVDMKGKEVPSSLLIGNGSRVIAYFTPKEWVHKDSGRSGVRAQWLGMKVKELIKYDPDAAAKAEAADAMNDDVDGAGFILEEDSSVPEDTTQETNSVDTNEEFDELFEADNTTA